MKLKDINAAITYDLWVRPEMADKSIELGIGYIYPDLNATHVYNLRINGKQHKVRLRETSSGIDLNSHLKRGYANLAEVMQVAKDDSALIKVIFFNGEIVEIGDIEVGIDEHIETTAKRNGIRFADADALSEVLNNKCKIRVGGEDFFLIMSGPAANTDFESEDQEDDDSLNPQATVQEKYREFSICGERIRIPVERRNIDKAKDIFFATKVIFKDNQINEGAMRLARGTVMFLDYTKTGRIRALAAGAMSQLTKETGSYLKQWDEYGAIEGELFLQKAISIGIIEYKGAPEFTERGKSVKFFITKPISKELTIGDAVELTDEIPVYVKNPDIKWAEYSALIEDSPRKDFNTKHKEVDNFSSSIKIANISNTSIEIELDMVPKQKYLIWSTKGEQTQIKRRMEARSAILEGRSANPLLGLLIEEGGILPDIQRVPKLRPLTSFVKDKIFKHSPTERQVEAIDVALNTPDIALIQGPPGTGKTTVVTAILERLNEEYDKTKSIRGQILVSGFQHDAVENIVSRLSVNALPAVKFGSRSTDSEFTEDAVTEKIYKWCMDIAKEIHLKNPKISQTEDQLRLAEFFVAYSLCPSRSNTINLMKRIIDLPRNMISEEITTEAEYIASSLQSELKSNDPHTLRLIRSLRVSEAAFEDDGPVRAIEVINRLEDKLSASDIEVLEKAGRWCRGKPLNFLEELKPLKERLLSLYLPSPDFRTEKPREDVLRLVANVSLLLEKSLNFTNKRDAILAGFLHEIEDNPDGVRESIEDYNFVFGATTQQSMGRAIKKSKNKYIRFGEKPEMPKYDTVVIDEAARTSPRDLLIPMSQAEKRIILVGDHRQLPHIIDEDIVRAVEEKLGDKEKSESDYVRESMFSYLKRRLLKLDEKQGYKPGRVVTLDAQYRTHPLLGKFTSDNFYQMFNEGYRSPLPAKLFEQQLNGIAGKAAVWIEVPYSQGKEEKNSNHSRYRISEALIIAEYVHNWINSKEGVELSFGVISFYKAQEGEVYKALHQYDISERAQDGTWQIASKYRFLENGEERLRIGTVDAFQGMEFDIVFLSMVRSQDINALPPYIRNVQNYKMKQQKIFGHLMSKNRLCVSMSRQKKVLALVGDGDLVNTQIAIDAVPALKNYYDLCNEQGAIL